MAALRMTGWEKFKRKERGGGSLIRATSAGSFAEELGLEAGDLVLSINRQTVTSVEEFDRLQGQLKSGMDVVLLVARQNEGTYTTLFLADRLP